MIQANERKNIVNGILILVGIYLFSSSLWIDLKKSKTYLLSDEASYYSMAMSLAHDFDLQYVSKDLERIYVDWSSGPQGIYLKKGFNGKIYYAKSYIYPLFCVPFVLGAKINGFLLFNSLLLWLSIYFSYRFLCKGKDSIRTLLWVFTFYIFSPVYIYHFWIHPEVFNIYLLVITLFLWFRITDRWETMGIPRMVSSIKLTILPVLLVAILTLSKPSSAIYILPILLYPFSKINFFKSIIYDTIIIFIFALACFLLFEGNYLFTGSFNYQGGNRKSFVHQFPGIRGNTFDNCGYYSTTSSVDISIRPKKILYNFFYYFFGRFTGIIPHCFPAVICLFLFISNGIKREYLREILILSSIIISIFVFITVVSDNYFGGTGSIGNRYFINFYPAFLFISRRVPGKKSLLLTWILGTLFMATLIVNPFHHSFRPADHAFSWVYKILPIELTQVEVLPIHVNHHLVDSKFGGSLPFRTYFFDYNSYFKECETCEGFWVKGSSETEFIAETAGLASECFIKISNVTIPNKVSVHFWNKYYSFKLKPGEIKTLTLQLEPGEAFKNNNKYLYKIRVKSTSGTTLENKNYRNLGCYVEIKFKPLNQP